MQVEGQGDGQAQETQEDAAPGQGPAAEAGGVGLDPAEGDDAEDEAGDLGDEEDTQVDEAEDAQDEGGDSQGVAGAHPLAPRSSALIIFRTWPAKKGHVTGEFHLKS